MTFGWARTEIIGGLVNGCFLLSLSVYIVLEAIPRLIPSIVLADSDCASNIEGQDDFYIGVAAAGLLINTIGTLTFHCSFFQIFSITYTHLLPLVTGQGHMHSHAGGGHSHSHGGHGGHGGHDDHDDEEESHGHSHAHGGDDHGHSHAKKKTSEVDDDHHGHSHSGGHGHSHSQGGKTPTQDEKEEGHGHSHSGGHGHSHSPKSSSDAMEVDVEVGHGHSHSEGHGHSHSSKKKSEEEVSLLKSDYETSADSYNAYSLNGEEPIAVVTNFQTQFFHQFSITMSGIPQEEAEA